MPNSGANTTRRRHATYLAAAIAALNALGFFLLFVLVAPRHFALSGGAVFGVGLGLTAYTLGIRHAFDADHIAAIDNVTRKLMDEGKEPISVGFFFSLGHSTVVVALGAIVALGVNGIGSVLENEHSALRLITGTWGPVFAGSFLLAVGALNVIVLMNLGKVFRRMRGGQYDESELDRQLENRGLMNRLYKRFTRSVSAPWQMYPIGVLFGFGFDTATEIVLLVLAGGAAAGGLPFYAVICLPILFAAGMALFDTLNSVLMNSAYGWALDRPARKVFYNLTTTGITAVSAVAIGALSLLGVLVERFELTGGVWDSVAAIDTTYFGYALVALMAATWLLAIAAWKFGGLEQRWLPEQQE